MNIFYYLFEENYLFVVSEATENFPPLFYHSWLTCRIGWFILDNYLKKSTTNFAFPRPSFFSRYIVHTKVKLLEIDFWPISIISLIFLILELTKHGLKTLYLLTVCISSLFAMWKHKAVQSKHLRKDLPGVELRYVRRLC